MTSRDVTDAMTTALSATAIVLQVVLAVLLVLALAALVFAPARRLLREIRSTLLGGELWMAWLVALVATLGSLWYSEVADFVPCRLCWMQRIAMYPLAAILLVAALRRDTRGGVLYAAVFPVAGAIVAAYHLYIEANPEQESAACKVSAPCSTKWIDEFGYVTLPMLAITAFLTIAALLLFAWSRRERRAPAVSPAPEGS
jgi:disulfide bond formation protein DsbB